MKKFNKDAVKHMYHLGKLARHRSRVGTYKSCYIGFGGALIGTCNFYNRYYDGKKWVDTV